MSELKSKVILVGNIKIDKDYINVLSYTEQQMLSLCESNAIASKDDYSFIHHQKSMFTDFTYNQCLQANYIAFQNKDYSNKWFFAFIDEIEFKGESNTEIKFTIDVWSTFYESIVSNAKPCLVTREHVNNDTIGLHTIPEDVDVGRVFCSDAQEDISLSQYGWIGILTTYDPAFDKDLSPVSVNNNILNASHLFLIEYNEYNFNNFNLFLYKCNKADKVGAIQNVFFVPSALVDRSLLIITTNSFIEDGTTYTYSYYKLPFSYEPKVLNQNINKNYNFTGITIKNNKCYCYPYNYLLATNNIGNQNIYKYEDFSTSNCQFKIQMAITPRYIRKIIAN
jgi:hypothetical protein